SEIVPAAPAKFDVPDSATGALQAVAGTTDSGFIVYVAATGEAHRWKADGAKGLQEATPQKVVLDRNLTGLTATRDGKVVYGITQDGKVKQYAIATGGSVTAKEVAPAGTPSALAAFELGAAAKP